MKNRMKNRINKGFTIIEVIIVLVIAAIIMLAVFLVVPQLQRAQRNTRRQQDARAVLTASTQYAANNNGFPLVDAPNGPNIDITGITGTRNIPGSTTTLYTYVVQNNQTATATTQAGSTIITVAKVSSCIAGIGATFIASPTSTAVGITLETNDTAVWLRYCITP